MIRRFFLVIFLWISPSVTSFAAEAGGLETKQNVAGWTLVIHPNILGIDATNAAVGQLRQMLEETIRVVPKEAVAKLQKVPLWFNPEYPNTPPRAEYHPGAQWLRDNGRDPLMAKGIEFTNIRIFAAEVKRMPNFALHELAHAYHDRELPEGSQNPEIAAAYAAAKAKHSYEQVKRRDAQGRESVGKAYALTNPQEYFAETTEAYFSQNDFFPFTKPELQAHDPVIFSLLGKLWGQVPEPVSVPVSVPSTVKVFVLAGQSNMEGQAVIDLEGKDYNQGKGTLNWLIKQPDKAAQFAHLQDSPGHWKVRDDVFVRYQREKQPLLAGPLAPGFSVYGDKHHFGPEWQCGHVLGDHFTEPVLLIKTAWGGKDLYRDFRPPTSGGAVGKYYQLMITQIREALSHMGQDFPALQGQTSELAGLIWYQGWNDGVNPDKALPEYEQNLVNLIGDFRKEFQKPTLPVVVGEITGAWENAPPEWEKLRAAQKAATKRPEVGPNVRFAPTRTFVRKAEDSPNPGHGHHEFGNAETYFLVGDALGKAMLEMLGN